MSRALSMAATHSAFAQRTDEAWLVLLTLSGGGIEALNAGEPLRFVNDWQDIVSAGETFLAYPFAVRLLTDEPEAAPQAGLTIDNVDLSILTILRQLVEPITATIGVVLASTPNTLEVEYDFEIREIGYDAQTIEAVLSFEPIMDEPVPGHTFCPTYYPGLYSHVEAAGVAGKDDVQLGTGGAYYERPKGDIRVPAKGTGGLAGRYPGGKKKEDE